MSLIVLMLSSQISSQGEPFPFGVLINYGRTFKPVRSFVTQLLILFMSSYSFVTSTYPSSELLSTLSLAFLAFLFGF